MSTITRASLEQQHPALFAQIREEFMAEGAAAENARIVAVFAQADGFPQYARLAQAMLAEQRRACADVGKAIATAAREAEA